MKTGLYRSWLLLACAAASAVAQTASPTDPATLAKYDKNKNGILDPDELAAQSDAVMLSPFEVRTDQDRGYQAINAGSGGRIDMEMRLTPAAMSVLTKEFLEDWNVTSMQESFRYAMNVDNGGFNPSGGGLTDFQFNFRGVGDSGNYPTRNYFLYYGNADSYNVERLEFSRGPNSVLFGDGQIGGVATTATKVPRLDRNAYTAAVRVDSWGGMRSTIDANQVVGGMTAVRVNALYQQNTFGTVWRDNSDGHDSAIDVAVAHAFTPRTKLRGEFEVLRYVRMSMSQTYGDNMMWYQPGYVFDSTAPNLPADQAVAGITAVSTNAENWTYIPALGKLVNTGGASANTRSYRSTGAGYPIQPDGRSDLPGINTVAKLPSREFNLGANDTENRGKYQVYNVFFDHRFTDSLSGQLSYYNYFQDTTSKSNARVGSLQIDINKYLPDGQLNPKVGKAYGEATPTIGNQFNYVREMRALLTWKGRLPFEGKTQISAILGSREESFRAKGQTPVRVDNPTVPNFTNAANSIRYRYYVDEPSKYGSRFLPPSTPGFTYAYRQTGFSMVEYKDIRYAQLVTASSFLNDRVSLVLGTRYDDMLTDNIQNIGNNADGTQIYGGFDPEKKATVAGAHNFGKAKPITYNAGTVAWLDKGQHLGAFYNYSKNFAPPPSGPGKLLGFNADGTLIQGGFGATTGSERSYGVRINFLDGAISGEARYYDGIQVDRVNNGSGSDGGAGPITNLWANSGATYANNPLLQGLQYRDVEAAKANGYEFQLTANFKGLRLSTNYALPDTEAVLVRPMVRAYADKFIPLWEKFAADGVNDKGDVLTTDNRTQLTNQVAQLRTSLANNVAGVQNNGTNKWTGAFNANYSFTRESKLRGFSVGWALSGRGPRKVGSVDPRIVFNLAPNATITPAQREAAAFKYLYSTSYWVQDANASYSRRIGKYNWRFQLNVQNLTDKDDLLFSNYGYYQVPSSANPNLNTLIGPVKTNFSYLDPRKFSFTTTVSF